MSLNGTVWIPIGPSPISEGATNDNGLVSAIAINPNNPAIIYIGTVGGGVWRSNDGGLHWKPLFDRQIALGIGEPAGIAIDPTNTNTIYVGTSGRFAPQPQAGLFKSNDGGASWIALGSGYPAGNTGNATLFVNQWINVVLVDPANSNIVYVAATGGLYRSTDGGQNFTPGSNGFGDARSFALDTTSPANARVLYAGISGRGVFQSTDGGQTWNQILSASTPVVATALGTGGIGKVIVALAPPSVPVPNPGGIQVIYVSMQGTGTAPDPVGLFLSANKGGTWVQQTATNMPTRTQGGYSFHFAVDPVSPGDGVNDIIYFGAVSQARSANSGTTFTSISGLHADTHSWAFIARSGLSSIVFSGNDGGIDKSSDSGVTWTSLNGGGLQTGLFYNIDFKPDATGSVTVGALQDNEIETTRTATAPGWIGTNGGDGWDVAYDGVTPGQVYASSGFWSSTPPAPPIPCTLVFRSTDDGVTFPFSPTPTGITPWTTATDGGCYLAPVTTDPSNAGFVYVSGSQNLWQSRNAGGSWRILSPFPGTGNVDVAPANGNNVAIGVGNQVFVSTNALLPTVGAPAGVTFTNITRNLPSRNVTRVAFDPNDPTVLYAILGGFNGGGAGQSGHVFRTTVGGTVWTDLSPALNIPFNAIALDGSDTPSGIYVGTDFGVLRSLDGGSSWSVLDDIHFPRVPVLDLVYRNGILRAGTYGRGAFTFAKPAGGSIAIELESGLFFGSVCKGPQFLDIDVYNVGSSDLTIFNVQRLMGSSDFVVLPTPATPLVIPPGEDVKFTVMYNPTSPGAELATIRISSNDPAAPFVDVAASGILGTGSLATAIADNGSLGNACVGNMAEAELTLNNNGTCPLLILGVTSSSPEFVAPHLSGPLLIGSGDSLELTIRFQPSSFGSKAGTITIFSNDPAGPRAVPVSGVAPAPRLSLVIANTGNFGNCCVGSFKDEVLVLNNSGRCTLSVTGITSSTGEFLVPEVLSYPLTIEAGGELQIPVRFQAASFGAKAATITVTSDDPAGPHSIALSGNAPSGKLAVTGSAYFGGVKCGRREFRTIAVCNVGDCDLHVTKVAFEHENRHWRLVHNPFPATLHPGSCLNVTIRYLATQKEPRCTEVVLKSDDPVTPVKEVEAIAWTRCCCRKCCEQCCAGHCCEERHAECCEEHHRKCCEHHDEHCRERRDGPEGREKHHEEHHDKEHHHGTRNEGGGDED
jgi:photosystem II stability/assembly factor-like uncharacterized protein